MVMTPAVLAATKAAKVEKPLPYLFACALVANAASFVLPISNPANPVLFGGRMPPLMEWLKLFGVPIRAVHRGDRRSFVPCNPQRLGGKSRGTI